MFKLFNNKKKELKLGDKVTVESNEGIILGEEAVITSISPCKNFIQTTLGLSYIPKDQIKKK